MAPANHQPAQALPVSLVSAIGKRSTSPLQAALPAVSAHLETESLVGRDNRIRISRTTDWPYRAIVYIRAYYARLPHGWFLQGTGTLIGTETVLTAGHVIYDKKEGGWANRVEVIPAYNAGYAPYGTTSGTKWAVYNRYNVTQAPTSDVGFIKLKTAIGTRTGTLPTTTGAHANETETLSGYSGDLNGRLGVARGKIAQLGGGLAYYQMDSAPGASGSGLYDTHRQVQIVHTSGGDGWNAGVIISTRVQAAISYWKRYSVGSRVNHMGYVTHRWPIYSDPHATRRRGTLKANASVRISYDYLGTNGHHYVSLYNNRGQFLGYANAAAVTRTPAPTPVRRTMTVQRRNYTRWNNRYESKKRGTSNQIYHRRVYVANRYVIGKERVLVSIYTHRGGHWLGFVGSSALKP